MPRREEPDRPLDVAAQGKGQYSSLNREANPSPGAMMNNRIAILLGGVVLIAVGAVGTLRVLSAESPQASVAEAIPAPEAMAYLDQTPVDPAREPIPLDRSELIPMTVYLSPTCGCCGGWVEHIKEFGFDVTLEYRVDLTMVKEGFAVRPELSSCHTAVVNGYIVEGHVPGEVVRQFLAEAPPVRGLTVPGMPIGSPGMEMGGRVDPYDVLTFTSTGQTAVYSRQGRS